MDPEIRGQLINFYAQYVTERKKQVIGQVLEKRTRHLTVVLEDIYQPQNASATVRTCDCFGIQDLYIIEDKHKYEVNPRVVHGASKWIDIFQYNGENEDNLTHCVRSLRDKAYRLVGTSPDPDSQPVADLDISDKTAIIFGTENSGLSEKAKEYCDEMIHIPMYGFTESFNISVSVAIILNILTGKLHTSTLNWTLSQEEKEKLIMHWYRKIVPRSTILEKEFLKQLDQSIE